MKIIVVEGADKGGKHTNSVLLAKELNKRGFKVVHSEFPRYDTPTGKLIQDILYNRLDQPVDQYTFELAQATDKQAQQVWFNQLEKEGTDFLILDRYYLTQLAYGKHFIKVSEDLTLEEKNESYQEELDWQKSLVKHLRKPDYTIYLDVDPKVSMLRKGQHGENDKYENDLDLLNNLRDNFFYFAKDDLIVIDANREMSEVNKDIIELAKKFEL